MTMITEFECVSVDVIEWEAIEQLCPTEAAALSQVQDKYGLHPENFVDYFEYDEDPEYLFSLSFLDPETADPEQLLKVDIKQATTEVEVAWHALVEAFAKATRVDESYLTLHARYHDPEEDGCPLDEVDGLFFTVEDGCKQSAAFDKFKDKFKQCRYLEFERPRW